MLSFNFNKYFYFNNINSILLRRDENNFSSAVPERSTQLQNKLSTSIFPISINKLGTSTKLYVVYMYEASFNCIIIVIITFNIYQY